MENPPYSTTGKFVENLKTSQQNSTNEKDASLYSEYVPKYIQKNWKTLFSKELFGIGKDILYQKNLLIEYGFTIQRPPASEQGSSQYSFTEEDLQIIMWGFGMIFATGNTGIFLWRHEFVPKLLDVSLLPSNVWAPDQIKQLTIPKTSDEKRLMLQILIKSIKWLVKYENWIISLCGESYRGKSLESQGSPNVTSIRLDQKWSEINEKFEKILKKIEPEQTSEIESKPLESKPLESKPLESKPLESKPVASNSDRSTVIPKNTCGACGENYPEDIQFCPSCNWEDLPC